MLTDSVFGSKSSWLVVLGSVLVFGVCAMFIGYQYYHWSFFVSSSGLFGLYLVLILGFTFLVIGQGMGELYVILALFVFFLPCMLAGSLVGSSPLTVLSNPRKLGLLLANVWMFSVSVEVLSYLRYCAKCLLSYVREHYTSSIMH